MPDVIPICDNDDQSVQSGNGEEPTEHNLWFNVLPPSANTYYRNFRGHMVLSPKGREFKQEMAKRCAGLQQIRGPVSVSLVLKFADSRRRDLDNYFKAMLDAFKNILFEDDSLVMSIRAVKICPHRGCYAEEKGSCAAKQEEDSSGSDDGQRKVKRAKRTKKSSVDKTTITPGFRLIVRRYQWPNPKK